MSDYYPEGMNGRDYCYVEGCPSNPCFRCGQTNYAALGFQGFLARKAKEWDCTREEAENRWLTSKGIETGVSR